MRSAGMSASTTIVMRDTPSRSVWPTVSDAMLKARRRKSDATRFSTPGIVDVDGKVVNIRKVPWCRVRCSEFRVPSFRVLSFRS